MTVAAVPTRRLNTALPMSFEAPVVVFFLTLLIAGACLEIGYRIGCWDTGRHPSASRDLLGSALAAHLGLLAFMLAITFGIAGNRLAERKALVIDEANAIGTAGLRATILEEPHASNVRRILAEYTRIRAVLLPEARITVEEARSRTKRLTADLWREARWAAREGKPNPEATALFVASVNEVIDTGTKRETVAFRHHIPRAVWFSLGFIGVLCALLLGYQGAWAHRTHPWVTAPLVVALALVIALIDEIDSPGGVVRLGQEPMKETLESLSTPAPP